MFSYDATGDIVEILHKSFRFSIDGPLFLQLSDTRSYFQSKGFKALFLGFLHPT